MCGHVGHHHHCLCDVEVTSPSLTYRGPLMFGQLALDEIDSDTVSRRNFVEFASVLLGCYEEHLRLPPPDLQPYEVHHHPLVTLDREVKTTTAHQALAPVQVPRGESPVKLGSFRSKQPDKGGGPHEWNALPQDVRDHLKHHWSMGTPWSRVQHLVGADPHDRLRYYYQKRDREYRGGLKYTARKRARKVSA